MELPYKCPMCSRTFRTPQGRRGHLTFKHGMGKRSIYTDAVKTIIDGYKEGIEYVKEKRRRLPQSVLDPEKRAKALAFARELEGRGEEKEEKIKEDVIFEDERRRYEKSSGVGLQERRGYRRSTEVDDYDVG